ncbi:hypothetical protein [Streptacidiphilus carbonis]|uniref:hypothetical protein n=1 Tax=Streptacidiphilus carbonis TaxID=105422 RepID=UPI0005A8A873|nr:hypothetical protein [Streptacidiphilus carbonis]
MPDALPIPDDLIQLQRAYDQATAELNEHVARVTAEQKERFPDPPGVIHDADQALLRATWSDEDNAMLDQLRAAQVAALAAMNQHPVMRQAMAEGQWPAIQEARQKAARGSGEQS